MLIVKLKNKLWVFTVISCFVLALSMFVGCDYKGYSGKRTDLYTVAVNSVLWNNGYSYQTERVTDPQIEIIDTDEFGRTLFTYYEKYYAGAKLSFSALMISQGSLDGYVYFYEDSNYLIKEQELYSKELKNFTKEEIDYLKSLNDWNKVIDLQKCTKKKINKNKQDIPVNSQNIVEKTIAEFNLVGAKYNINLDYLTNDDNGNFIVYGLIICFDEKDIYFAAMVKKNGDSINWFVPENLYNYQIEFKNFKRDNSW